MTGGGRALSVAAAWLAAALTPAAAQGGPASEQRGERLLSRHCAMCHAIGRTGGSPHPEAPAFRALGQRYPVESLEESLAEGLLTGHPDMPEFKFAPQDVGAIIAYLQSIQVK